MALKRKASLPSTPPATKRRTRSHGAVEVVIPPFEKEEWKRSASRQFKPLPPKSRGARRAPKINASNDSGDDADDLDILGSASRAKLPVTPRTTRSRRSPTSSHTTTSVASSSSAVEEPSPTKTRSAQKTYTSLSKTLAIRRAQKVPLTTSAPSVPSTRSPSPTTDDQDISAPLPSSLWKGKGKAVSETDGTEDEEQIDDLLASKALATSEDELPNDTETSPVKQQQPHSSRNGALSPQFHLAFQAQRRAILRSLIYPPAQPSPIKDLTALLRGTTERGEGNSCLILGPRGSGKSRLVEDAISDVSPYNPIIIRLSAESQHDDKLAMREMARQLVQQTGSSYVLPTEDRDGSKEDSNDLLASADTIPTTHLPALIATLTTLSRPTIVVLEAFDLFAQHSRQALLYCLLDTAQSCHAHGSGNTDARGSAKASGIAVIGIITRVDYLNLFEKRVKSRFSGRIIRVSPPNAFADYVAVSKAILEAPIKMEDYDDGNFDEDEELLLEWEAMWKKAVDTFLSHKMVDRTLKDLFSLVKDIRTLCRVLTSPVLRLSPNAPWLIPRQLQQSFETQVAPAPFSFVPNLPYPCLALLIASHHVSNTGNDVFNFEMLWANVSRQVERTASMPVTVDGASVGMTKVARGVMIGAFERLIALRVFQANGPISANVAKTFGKYRCAVTRAEIGDAVEKSGNLKLRSWFRRAAE